MTKTVFRHEARQFKALAHPKRLEILSLLHRHQLTASDIQQMTGFAQANLSQHLALLKSAQIIVAVRHGQHIRYRLSHQNFWRASQLLAATQVVRMAKKHESSATQVQDPVCQMWIEPAAARWQTIYKGATFFFCASGCHRRFVKSPAMYA